MHARRDPPLGAGHVVVGEGTRRQFDHNLLGLTGIQSDLGEAAQFPPRPDHGAGCVVHVHLDHVTASPGPGVGDRNRDEYRLVGSAPGSVQRHIAVLEGRVAQAVAEAEQRSRDGLRRPVPHGQSLPVLDLMRVSGKPLVGRNIGLPDRERFGQAPGGFVVAEQHVAQR